MELIYSILSKNNIKWFVDSGSLLGIVREGKFLSWDKGVDISVLIDTQEDIPNVIRAVAQIKDLGFYIAKLCWNKKIYKYVMSTTNPTKYPYNVDLHLFVRRGDSYVCPQISSKKDISYIKKLRNMFLGVKKGNPVEKKDGFTAGLKYYIKSIYKSFVWKHDNEINMNKYVQDGSSDVYYWNIPSRFLTSFVKIGKDNVMAPAGYIEYLEYRYGDWKIPKKDWVFIRDDHSIQKSNINEINEIINDLYQTMNKGK